MWLPVVNDPNQDQRMDYIQTDEVDALSRRLAETYGDPHSITNEDTRDRLYFDFWPVAKAAIYWVDELRKKRPLDMSKQSTHQENMSKKKDFIDISKLPIDQRPILSLTSEEFASLTSQEQRGAGDYIRFILSKGLTVEEYVAAAQLKSPTPEAK